MQYEMTINDHSGNVFSFDLHHSHCQRGWERIVLQAEIKAGLAEAAGFPKATYNVPVALASLFLKPLALGRKSKMSKEGRTKTPYQVKPKG